MLSPESFLHIWQQETGTCLRIFAKLPPGALDYRPTAGQRSTLELLRYLSFGPFNGLRRVVLGDWSFGPVAAEYTKDWPPSDFVAKMKWQAREAANLVRAANPIDLETKTITFPWGETLIRSEALVRYPLNWLCSYRMQLFLYLKAAGAKELGTPDLWRPVAE